MHGGRADVVIIGGGLSGLVCAIELLGSGSRVVLLERDEESRLGGMARDSFGGVTMFDTPAQRRLGIRDNPELALADWVRTAQFGDDDVWPRSWAENYIERSPGDLYGWLAQIGVRFFPVVHWVERGLFQPANSVPRFHMVWGSGEALVVALLRALEAHPRRSDLQILCGFRVERLITEAGRVAGCSGIGDNGHEQEFRAGAIVVASGGICGDIALLRKHWFPGWGTPPELILNGAHRFADGLLHGEVRKIGGRITHLEKQWHYPAGVHHPRPRQPGHGISLVPPKSALWMDYRGKRIGPQPLVTGFDTRFLVEQICLQDRKYSWQILNRKIALKELAVSGSEFNPSLRRKKALMFLKEILFGNRRLVDDLTANCPDFVTAASIEELADKMNFLQGDSAVDPLLLRTEIERYDSMIDRGRAFHDDDQLRRIAHARQYRGDRVRTCKFQKILDPKAMPLIAIREFVLSRKTLGGMQTDLESRVLNESGTPIPGLFAVGEAAGFGGGGIHGIGALEGTFLGSCILTGQTAARAITGKKEGKMRP